MLVICLKDNSQFISVSFQYCHVLSIVFVYLLLYINRKTSKESIFQQYMNPFSVHVLYEMFIFSASNISLVLQILFMTYDPPAV